VEDDNVNRLALRELLRFKDYRVDLAANGKEALSLLRKNKYDLILLDIQMPVLGGLETFRIIRGSEEFKDHARTPVIALTAFAMKGDKEKFLDSGMNDYISKPVEVENLYSVIERILKR